MTPSFWRRLPKLFVLARRCADEAVLTCAPAPRSRSSSSPPTVPSSSMALQERASPRMPLVHRVGEPAESPSAVEPHTTARGRGHSLDPAIRPFGTTASPSFTHPDAAAAYTGTIASRIRWIVPVRDRRCLIERPPSRHRSFRRYPRQALWSARVSRLNCCDV